MKIAIIGAGISGLTAAHALARDGHQVEIFERDNGVGGLISTFDFDGTRIERYYHFLCGGDHGYTRLCETLGLASRIKFTKAPTGFFYEGREYGFSTPLDLLRFTPIPLMQRIRFGIFALEARLKNEWAQLDEIPARPWLIDRIGLRAYEVIWHPLLSLKFGQQYEQISAAWIWHRLHRVARSKGKMGYLEGGTGLLLDTLLADIEAHGGTVHTNTPVKAIATQGEKVQGLVLENGQTVEFDRVVSTVPLSVLADMLPGHDAYAQQLRRIQYIGVVCAIFKLKKPVTNNFWLNINDRRTPCNGIIEYTNLNPLGKNDNHIVYVPYYVATDNPLYSRSDEDVFRQSWAALQLINPGLRDSDLIAHRVFRSTHAQAICPTNFLRMIPEQVSPIQGLRLLDSIFLYPEDRTQSGLILHALTCARGI